MAVLVAGGDADWLGDLRRMLTPAGLRLVAARDAARALAALRRHVFDIVLLDLDMPVMNGRDALAQMLVGQPNLAVLMLTVSEDGEDLAECMKTGARGYLLKNINADFLLDSIRRAVDGDSVLSPEMTAKLVARLRAPVAAPRHSELDSLTPRERETLGHLALGSSNKEIARALDLAESTVKVHVQNILRKLGISSRVQAAVYAVEHGLDKP